MKIVATFTVCLATHGRHNYNIMTAKRAAVALVHVQWPCGAIVSELTASQLDDINREVRECPGALDLL